MSSIKKEDKQMCKHVDELAKDTIRKSQESREEIRMIMESTETKVPLGTIDRFSEINGEALLSGKMWIMGVDGEEGVQLVKVFPGAESQVHKHVGIIEYFLGMSGETNYIIYKDDGLSIYKQGSIRFGELIEIPSGSLHVILSSKEISYVALKTKKDV